MLLPVPFRHQLLGKGVAIGPAFGIKTRAGITVPVPGAADVRAGLEEPYGHAPFAQAAEHIHAGNPGADDDSVVDRKLALACAFRQGVCVRHELFPYRDTRPKFMAGHQRFHRRGKLPLQRSSTRVAQSPSAKTRKCRIRALALLDTANEPAITVE